MQSLLTILEENKFIFSFVYESPRWLIQQGRIDEALIILKAITRINGTNEISDQMINHVISNERQVIALLFT